MRIRRCFVALVGLGLAVAPSVTAVGHVGAVAPVAAVAEVAAGEAGDLSYDLWHDRWGQSLGDVAIGTEPSSTSELVGAFETPNNIGDQYAVRIRSLFTPAKTGDYRFFVSGDDDARLFLNPDGDDPAGAQRVAYIAGWTTYHQWDRYGSQRSAEFRLKKGEQYYIEAIGKEGSGDDSVAVAMQLDDGPVELIPGELIEATSLGEGGWRTATPLGLPDVPAPTNDPGWLADIGVETMTISWAPVDEASWYEVRLEGGGQYREIDSEASEATFVRLVPNTRYLVEVTPVNAAGTASTMTGLFITLPGEYPTPVPAEWPPDGEPTVSYDRWNTGWWTLTSIPDGLPPVSSSTLNGGFETPAMQGENHAARIRALLTPEKTGDYTFHLSSDDDGRLLFNPSGRNANEAIAIASVAGWTQQYQWDRYDSQTSATFRLKAGHEYYIEALAVHALDLDHLEVGWSRAGQEVEVIPPEVLSPTMAGAGGWRNDATDLPRVPNKPKHLEAGATSSSLSVTWDPPKVTSKWGEAVFYELHLNGEGIEFEHVLTETELLIDDLPATGQFWLEVTAWNAAGQSKPAAHTVHTRDSGDDDDDDDGDGDDDAGDECDDDRWVESRNDDNCDDGDGDDDAGDECDEDRWVESRNDDNCDDGDGDDDAGDDRECDDVARKHGGACWKHDTDTSAVVQLSAPVTGAVAVFDADSDADLSTVRIDPGAGDPLVAGAEEPSGEKSAPTSAGGVAAVLARRSGVVNFVGAPV